MLYFLVIADLQVKFCLTVTLVLLSVI